MQRQGNGNLSRRVLFSKESRCITRLVTLRAPPLRGKQIRLEEEVARRRNTEARNLLKCTPMANVVVLRARLTSDDIFFKTDVRCIATLVACPKTQRSHKCGRHKKEKKKGKEKWTREAHPVVVIMAEDLAVSYFAQIARVIIKLS